MKKRTDDLKRKLNDLHERVKDGRIDPAAAVVMNGLLRHCIEIDRLQLAQRQLQEGRTLEIRKVAASLRELKKLRKTVNKAISHAKRQLTAP
jgi:hypothetical protein